MTVTVILADMLEVEDGSIHIGNIPCLVNNQNGLEFKFEQMMDALRIARRPRSIDGAD